jgi:hypothetical protein
MNNTTLKIKVRQRLNKLASNDYDNITDWQIVEAFNKGTLQWVRRNLHGYNMLKEGDEESKRRMTDLQVLLKEKSLKVLKHDIDCHVELPNDFMEWKRVSVKAKANCCDEKQMITYLVKEEDIDILLKDFNTKPNFSWGETLCTLIGNKLKVYTNDEFVVTDLKLTYYKVPIKVEFGGISNAYTGEISKKEIVSEFKDDVVEVLIDEAVKILSGDIESVTANQIAESSTESNN